MTQIPQTDSISELVRFWDSHDVTELEDELEEVTEPIFVRREKDGLVVPLGAAELGRLRELATSLGIPEESLIQRWVREKLAQAGS